MLRIKEYVKVSSVEEAYELLQKNRKNRIIGGMMWMRLSDTLVPVGIDLGNCGLDQIEETEDEVKIGAMVTLRALETSPVLAGMYDGIVGESVKDIVGVQFRNLATIGGSIHSRFGFSDILTALLSLPADVVLHHEGRISLEEFVNQPYKRDVLTHIIIKKGEGRAAYLTERRSATDFPMLAVAVSHIGEEWNISIGARPSKAQLMKVSAPLELEEEIIEEIKEKVLTEFSYSSNMRGSQEYRELLAKTLTERAIRSVKEECRC